MGKQGGFLEVGRKDHGTRPKEERLKDFRSVAVPLEEEELFRQAARCMDCGIPFCHAQGCPLANLIPEFNDHVYHHRWREALAILLETNPFPEFTGRICPAPCETSCVLGINDDPVTIRGLELAIVEKAFAAGDIRPQPPRRRQEGRVAIVGSGPAGLTAAWLLNRRGYRVTVYENAARPGGILRYGIPDFKLEKWVIDRRIDLMAAEGVRFENGVEIGEDISYRYLKNRFDAVLLTGGARQPRDLDIPGRELTGIEFAMSYLVQQNRILGGEPVDPKKLITASHKMVVILGGGDTGSDCLGTALRQGARKVRQFEILPEPPPRRSEQTPWPEWPVMRRDSSSHREGGERRWSVMTEAFVGEKGRVRQLRCCDVEWVPEPPGGRAAPRKVPGSEFEVEADLVLLSMGFVGPGRNRLVESIGLELNERGFVHRDARHMTSQPGIFVAGDMSAGASLVVRAMQDGLATARGVMGYLEGRP